MNKLLSPKSVNDFLERTGEVSPEGVAVRKVSSCEALGRRWREIGVRSGDLVLLGLPNGVALLEQFFGILAAEAVPALVAPSTPLARLLELAQVLRARAIGLPRVNSSALGAQQRETVGCLEVGLFEATESPAANPGEVVLLTSGTSGFASGCVFPIESLLLNAERHAEAIGQRSEDVVLVNLPLHFSFAMVAQALATFVRGGRLILSGPPFHPPTYSRTLARYGVTISSLTPLLVRSLLHVDPSLATGLRVLTVGGDALAPEDVGRLLQWRPGGQLYLTYGLTQAGPRVATLAAHDEPPHRHCSVGRPLAGTKVFLKEIGDGTGMKQLLVSSACVMRRRIGLVEGAAHGELETPGTIATGDIFEQDADGYLYFLGRLTDYIIRDGDKICLAAVRRVATSLPHVIHARTSVVRREDGETDFDLMLHPSKPGQDYTGLLRKMLRSAEMPRRIHIEVAGHANSSQYK